MLKEIMEQPTALEDAMRGRAVPDTHEIVLGGLHRVMDALRDAQRIVIAACGTSWHSALVGEYLIEHFARVPVEVEYASEFRYRDPILRDGDVVLVISQSGETADTLAAVREAKQSKAFCAWASATSSALPSHARPTRACTCTPGPRSASRPPRRSQHR